MKTSKFDIERAKKGDKVITRDGRKVRIVCFDRKNYMFNFPIIALVLNDKMNAEEVFFYTKEGKRSFFDTSEERADDLLMEDSNESYTITITVCKK